MGVRMTWRIEGAGRDEVAAIGSALSWADGVTVEVSDRVLEILSEKDPALALRFQRGATLVSPEPDRMAEAMQLAWNDWVTDTECYPDEFRIEGRALFADFRRGVFAGKVAGWYAALTARLLDA